MKIKLIILFLALIFLLNSIFSVSAGPPPGCGFRCVISTDKCLSCPSTICSNNKRCDTYSWKGVAVDCGASCFPPLCWVKCECCAIPDACKCDTSCNSQCDSNDDCASGKICSSDCTCKTTACSDCKNTYYGKNNAVGIGTSNTNCGDANTDKRFLCSDYKWYDCNWPDSDRWGSWSTKIENGGILWSGTEDWLCVYSSQKWWPASLNKGKVKINSRGNYDSVSNGGSWLWCDSNIDGEGGLNGIKISNYGVVGTTDGLSHDYLCYQNGAYESFAECCGNENCLSAGSDGVRVSLGSRSGSYVCNENEKWETCPSSSITDEKCDNLDNDCDGYIDESLSQGCYTGSANTRDVGICKNGTQTCRIGSWSTCENEVLPQQEKCNLADDDCNGLKDDGCAPPTPEICDNKDNNYDGQIDEGCDDDNDDYCDSSMNFTISNACPSGGNDCDDSNALINPGRLEVCDGIDNNCNNMTDEGCTIKVYWTNMIEKIISRSAMRDTVKLMVTGSNLEGKQIIFTIYRFESLLATDTPIINTLADLLVKDKYIESLTATVGINNNAIAIWKVPDAAVYYAYAQIANKKVSNASYSLNTLGTIEDNTAPFVKIISPEYGNVFSTNKSIQFTQQSYDEDDSILTYLWDFGNGYKSTEKNPSYAYIENKAGENGGPRTISLTVSDPRGGEVSDFIKILVNSTSDDAPLAVISSPKDGSSIISNKVLCNATLSVDDLTPPDNLTFTWKFDDNDYYSAKGMEGALYGKSFPTAGNHWTELTVSDNNK